MSRSLYNSHVRKITKMSDGTYFSQRYSVGFYLFLELCKLFFKLLFFWIYIPYKLLSKKWYILSYLNIKKIIKLRKL